MIKNIFNPGNYSQQINFVLLLIRIGVGVLMLTHGYGKLLKLFGDEPIKFGDPIGIGAVASLSLTVFAEVFCSVCLIFGFATRFAAIPLFVTMVVAGFIVHGNDEFKKIELPLMYLLLYITIIIIGPGKYSVDSLIYKKINQR